VRSLARDMGRDMGCFGHISELRRVEVEPFTSVDFVTIAELEVARFGVVEGNADATDIADATVAADTAEAADKVEVPI
ncbi:tRNA pseudouridine(55) synthase TruB, partial [Mesorhizobium sp. M7A.F.Ca.MR.148.00.0.0]